MPTKARACLHSIVVGGREPERICDSDPQGTQWAKHEAEGSPNANPTDLLCFIYDCLLTIDETLAFPYLSLLKRGGSTPLSLVGFLNRVLFVSHVSFVSFVSFVSYSIQTWSKRNAGSHEGRYCV